MRLNPYGSKEDLLAALRRGDNKAYDHLYSECRPVIFHFMARNNGTKEEGLDLLQEALIVLFKKLHQPEFSLTASPRTYIYSICRKKWLNHLRKNAPGKIIDLEDVQEHLAVDWPETDDRPTDVELEKAVSRLDELCRELIVRFYYSRQSLEEIARELNLGKANAVKVRKHRCMQRLKELI